MSVTKVGSGGSTLNALHAASSAEMNRVMGKRLREAAEIIAVTARGIAAGFSKRTAESIKVAGGSTGVLIVAQGSIAPNAYPFEYGSYHPVFARGARSSWTWRKQPQHEFMAAAAEASAEAAAELFSLVFDDWSAQLNL